MNHLCFSTCYIKKNNLSWKTDIKNIIATEKKNKKKKHY